VAVTRLTYPQVFRLLTAIASAAYATLVIEMADNVCYDGTVATDTLAPEPVLAALLRVKSLWGS
jgi:hypothetical protein